MHTSLKCTGPFCWSFTKTSPATKKTPTPKLRPFFCGNVRSAPGHGKNYLQAATRALQCKAGRWCRQHRSRQRSPAPGAFTLGCFNVFFRFFSVKNQAELALPKKVQETKNILGGCLVWCPFNMENSLLPPISFPSWIANKIRLKGSNAWTWINHWWATFYIEL